jgi:hypothetical protein
MGRKQQEGYTVQSLISEAQGLEGCGSGVGGAE